jgi:hypothetical protein
VRAALACLVLAGCLVPADRAPELCNGLDDDNDLTTDDGIDEPMLGTSCDSPDSDACTAERIACRGGQLVCAVAATAEPFAETCNCIDDDCDGEIDETFAFERDPTNCGFCGNACRNANGTTACVDGACVPACTAGAVDCNGSPDDGCEVFRDRNPACTAPLAMGSLAGDLGGASLELTGTDETTLEVVVREDSTIQAGLTATLVLDNPPGVNFDLVVTCGGCGGAVMGSSTNPAGMPDTVQFRAEDVPLVNDARTLHIEVRFASATACAAPWHLEVTGATAVTTTTCP